MAPRGSQTRGPPTSVVSGPLWPPISGFRRIYAARKKLNLLSILLLNIKGHSITLAYKVGKGIGFRKNRIYILKVFIISIIFLNIFKEQQTRLGNQRKLFRPGNFPSTIYIETCVNSTHIVSSFY